MKLSIQASISDPANHEVRLQFEQDGALYWVAFEPLQGRIEGVEGPHSFWVFARELPKEALDRILAVVRGIGDGQPVSLPLMILDEERPAPETPVGDTGWKTPTNYRLS